METRITIYNFVKIVYNICLQVDLMNNVDNKYKKIIDQYRDIVLSSNHSAKTQDQLLDMIPNNVTDIINMYFRPVKEKDRKCCLC